MDCTVPTASLPPGDPVTELLLESQRLGFLGPGPVSDHRSHAQAFVHAGTSVPRRALDLGSGGGIPGLLLISTPGWEATQWSLLDARGRRCRFLARAVTALGVQPRVAVLHGRAEELGRRPDLRASYDLVVARSFGAPPLVAECAAPFLAIDGRLVVSEPPTGRGPSAGRWPPEPLAELGLVPLHRVATGESTIMVLAQRERCSGRFPRRTGTANRAPLYRVAADDVRGEGFM